MSAITWSISTNTDVPGMIGFIGTTLGSAGVNIANFQLGRDEAGRRCDRAALCRRTGGREGAGGTAFPSAGSVGQGLGIQRRLTT
jgi:hypothetical protein